MALVVVVVVVVAVDPHHSLCRSLTATLADSGLISGSHSAIGLSRHWHNPNGVESDELSLYTSIAMRLKLGLKQHCVPNQPDHEGDCGIDQF